MALPAIHSDPFRERAQRALIEAYLAEGNLAHARRALAGYSDLVRRELGVAAPTDLIRLVQQPSRTERAVARTDAVRASIFQGVRLAR